MPGSEQSTRRSLGIQALAFRNAVLIGFATPDVSHLSFNTTVTDRIAVVTLAGELDVAGASALERELERVAADHSPTTLVLDLSGLDFMDSTGLRLVVLADQRAQEEGRRLVLVRGNESVQRVFAITRMEERLSFVDDAAEAAA